jgi:hypothetical protein
VTNRIIPLFVQDQGFGCEIGGGGGGSGGKSCGNLLLFIFYKIF